MKNTRSNRRLTFSSKRQALGVFVLSVALIIRGQTASGRQAIRNEKQDTRQHRRKSSSAESSRVAVSQDSNNPRPNERHIIWVIGKSEFEIAQTGDPKGGASDHYHDHHLPTPPVLLVVHGCADGEDRTKSEQGPEGERLEVPGPFGVPEAGARSWSGGRKRAICEGEDTRERVRVVRCCAVCCTERALYYHSMRDCLSSVLNCITSRNVKEKENVGTKCKPKPLLNGSNLTIALLNTVQTHEIQRCHDSRYNFWSS